MKSCKHSVILLLFCLSVLFSFGQSGDDNQNLFNITDSTIKLEIESFSIANKSKMDSAVSLRPPLIEIPLQHCSDSEVHFGLSKFNSSVSTFIHLYFKGLPKERSLDSIFVVTHSHFWIKIPRSAYDGIYQSLSCDGSNGSGKKSRLVSPNYKAYYSANKRRMYIYMIGGSEGSKYEVTWVFVDDRYLTRVLGKIE